MHNFLSVNDSGSNSKDLAINFPYRNIKSPTHNLSKFATNDFLYLNWFYGKLPEQFCGTVVQHLLKLCDTSLFFVRCKLLQGSGTLCYRFSHV